MNPRRERANIRAHYSADARAYASAWAPVLRWFASPLLEAIEILPGDRVLDLGCGTGGATRRLVERAGETGTVSGIDLTPEMLPRAGAEGAAFLAGDATRLPFRSGVFDVAVSNFVLHHFRAQVQTLLEARRVLATEGRIGLTLWGRGDMDSPAYLAWSELLDRFDAPEDPEATRPWGRLHDTPARARSLLERAGFGGVRAWNETRTHSVEADTFLLHVTRIGSLSRRLTSLPPPRRAEFLDAARSAVIAMPGDAFTWRGEMVYALGHIPRARTAGPTA